MHKPIRLIAMDMDGTLLNSDIKITKENHDAIHRAVQAGVVVALSSGRSHGSMLPYVQQLGISQPVISANGAVIMSPEGECWLRRTIPAKLLRQAVQAVDCLDITYDIYFQDRLVMLGGGTCDWYHLESASEMDYRHTDPEPWIQTIGDDAVKLIGFTSDEIKLVQMREALNAIDGLECSSSWHDNVEVQAKGVHKGSALVALADRLGIPIEQTMAIGDQGNDISMLRAAGLGVAMGNASETVRAQADVVTDTNDRSGVAKAIMKYVIDSE